MKSNKYINVLFEGAEGSTFENAKFLRKNETRAEKILWDKLRSKGLHEYKFRRQHAIGKFVTDFYYAKKKLVVELDGSVHNNFKSFRYDELRSDLLSDINIHVIRFKNSDVDRDIDKVLEKILDVLENI